MYFGAATAAPHDAAKRQAGPEISCRRAAAEQQSEAILRGGRRRRREAEGEALYLGGEAPDAEARSERKHRDASE